MPKHALFAAVLGVLSLLRPGPLHAQAGVDAHRLHRIPTQMQRLVDEGRIAGAVMLLARRDTVLLHEAVGFADRARGIAMTVDHLFSVTSIAKPTTALGILLLQDDGLVTMGDFIHRHLPEFQSVRPADAPSGSRPPVILEALTHTAGFPYERTVFDYETFPQMTLAEVVTTYAAAPLDAPPGTRFGYSSPGFDILGRIIEVVSEEAFESFMHRRVFEPLGMTDTAFRLSPEARHRLPRRYAHVDGQLTELEPSWLDAERRFPAPAFGMYSTAADLGALMRMMLNGGSHRGIQVVSEAAVGAMTANQIRDPEISPYGLGWAVAGNQGLDWDLLLASDRVFGHGGASGPLVWADPERDLVGVFMIHQGDGEGRHARRVFANLAHGAVSADKGPGGE
jgi:CubicO group peptidase (beta-lactamase class C family)